MATENHQRANNDREKLSNWIVRIALFIILSLLGLIIKSNADMSREGNARGARLDVMDDYRFTKTDALELEKDITEKFNRAIEKIDDRDAIMLACLGRVQRNMPCARGL